MNARMTAVLVICLGAASVLSCAREKAAPDAARPGAAAPAPREAPTIPVDVMPKLLTAPVTYPEEARARGEEGIVQVKALIGKDGRVIETAMEPGQTAPEALGKAAVESVKGWTFDPARAKGEPVEIWVVVPVRYRLH